MSCQRLIKCNRREEGRRLICNALVAGLSIPLNLPSIQGSDVSCCTTVGRELFNKFVDHCEVTEVDKRLIKDSISVFVFLAGSIVEEFER